MSCASTLIVSDTFRTSVHEVLHTHGCSFPSNECCCPFQEALLPTTGRQAPDAITGAELPVL